MLPLIIYILCIYMLLKAFEIFQNGILIRKNQYTSERIKDFFIVSVIISILAIIAAIVFIIIQLNTDISIAKNLLN